MLKYWVPLFVMCSVLTVTACHTAGPPPTITTGSLSELQQLHSTGSGELSTVEMRSQAIKDTALSLGAQGGLAWRAEQINQILTTQSSRLDQIFNFNRLMLDDHVLPPVLEMSEKNMKLDGLDTIRLSDQMYIIQAQAHFVSMPPNWRDYLWMSYKIPDAPPSNMLPETRTEQRVWEKNIVIGWQQGIDQANQILRDNLARLTRDVRGMILYRKLLLQGMVSRPFVDKNSLGITGGGDSLRINDQILQITALPGLQVDTRQWHPVVVPNTTSQEMTHS